MKRRKSEEVITPKEALDLLAPLKLRISPDQRGELVKLLQDVAYDNYQEGWEAGSWEAEPVECWEE